MMHDRRPRVLILGETSGDPAADAALRKVACVRTLPLGDEYETSKAKLKRAVDEEGPFVAFAINFNPAIPSRGSASVLSKDYLGPLAPHCKLYAGPGAGYDKVDLDWIASTGAVYANSPVAVGRKTADGAIMLLLGALRGVTPQDLSIRNGGWRDPSVHSIDWRSTTLGIIGLGNIGLQIAQHAQALSFAKIIYHSRKPDTSAAAKAFEYVASLKELCTRAGCVVVAVPLTPQTRHLLGKKEFAWMKDMVVVNIARGPVIDEEALVSALDKGQVLRAALDVFEKEPEVHPKLRSNPNVTLSPHVMAMPDSTFMETNAEVLDNVVAFVETGKPNTPVPMPGGGK